MLNRGGCVQIHYFAPKITRVHTSYWYPRKLHTYTGIFPMKITGYSRQNIFFWKRVSSRRCHWLVSLDEFFSKKNLLEVANNSINSQPPIHCSSLRKLYLYFLSIWMEYEHGDRFPFYFEPNLIPFGSKFKGKLSPRSYPIQHERKWKYSFLSAETAVCMQVNACAAHREIFSKSY